jgi:chromosome partitioning protein
VRPKIVAFITMKGGSGKSTSAICLAAAWQQQGVRVRILDTDPAATLSRWIELGEDLRGLPVDSLSASPSSMDFADLLAERLQVLAAEANWDRIVVDTPGFQSSGTEAVIRHADLIVVPMRPTPIDYQVAVDTIEYIQRLRNHAAPVHLLLNQSTRGSVIARHMREHILAAGYQALTAELPNRVIYPEAAMLGSTPSLQQPNGPAAVEIAELAAEIDERLARV